MTDSLLIRGARLLDIGKMTDNEMDILVVDGLIQNIAKAIRNGDLPPKCQVISGHGLIACSGFIDLHVHLREPGYEDKETIATGSLAAAKGGFTTICCMPNTNPPIDSASVVDYVLRKAREANVTRVLPIGCATKGRAGDELTEMWELAEAGVVGFSDDGYPVESAHVMRQALSYAQGLDMPIINHCEDLDLSQNAPVNEGFISNLLGLGGWPAAAEEVMVSRDIALAELTGGRLHLAHLTTAASVDMVRRAKNRGLNVTAEVTPHHLLLNEAWILGHTVAGPLVGPLSTVAYDTATKVNPPLRPQRDIDALIEGLRDGVIDAIATDHAPHAITDRLVTFEDAASGINGLETALGALMSLVHKGDISLKVLVERLTLGPVKVLGKTHQKLIDFSHGAPADIVLFDPDREWVVQGAEFASKDKTTPLEGITLKGQVVATISQGRLVHSLLPHTDQSIDIKNL